MYLTLTQILESMEIRLNQSSYEKGLNQELDEK